MAIEDFSEAAFSHRARLCQHFTGHCPRDRHDVAFEVSIKSAQRIKNGLIPLRNVMRHLAQVERDEPGALPAVFAERRQTVDSSIAYLETLATSYQRLSPPLDRRDCDLNALDHRRRPRRAGARARRVRDRPDADLPRVVGDPVAFRRILENLIANAVDSLQSKPGRITVSTQVVDRRRRAAGGPGDGRRHRPRHVRGRGRTDLQRLLHDEGGRHRAGALHRAAAGDGPPRHDRRRQRARPGHAHHHRHSGRRRPKRT